MYGCTRLIRRHVGQRQPVQFYRSFVGAGKIELTIGGSAAEVIGNLAYDIVHKTALCEIDMRPVDIGINILCHITGNGNGCSGAAIDNSNAVVGNSSIVDGHTDIAQCKCLVHDGERGTVCKCHLACLRCRKQVGHISFCYLQGLCRCCYRQQEG